MARRPQSAVAVVYRSAGSRSKRSRSEISARGPSRPVPSRAGRRRATLGSGAAWRGGLLVSWLYVVRGGLPIDQYMSVATQHVKACHLKRKDKEACAMVSCHSSVPSSPTCHCSLVKTGNKMMYLGCVPSLLSKI
jgi:hypothetical protein